MSTALSIAPLSERYETAFYDLLQEQASQHASTETGNSHQLAKAIFDGACEAFLVLREGTPVAAVTFYECLTEHGRGLYLEDIITAQAARKQGIGSFAMSHLASTALDRSLTGIVWECAVHNIAAQNFYDDLGSERCSDRHTWRLMETLKQRQPDLSSVRTRYHLCKEEVTLNGVSLSLTGNVIAARTKGSQNLLLAYRNFSTFRIVNGLHIEVISCNNPRNFVGMLERLGQFQQERGWNGHIDITVRDSQKDFLSPVLRSYHFGPLAYGHDQMITRQLRGEALVALAQREPSVPPTPSRRMLHRGSVAPQHFMGM